MEEWAETVVSYLDFIRSYLWNWNSMTMLQLGADDLVQEVALHLLIKGPPSDQSNLYAYFSVVSKRVAISVMRRRDSRPQQSEEGQFPRMDPSERAQWERELVEVLQSLASMPDKRASKAILLCAVGFKLEEVAEILGIHTDTVKRDRKTARAYLGKAA